MGILFFAEDEKRGKKEKRHTFCIHRRGERGEKRKKKERAHTPLLKGRKGRGEITRIKKDVHKKRVREISFFHQKTQDEYSLSEKGKKEVEMKKKKRLPSNLDTTKEEKKRGSIHGEGGEHLSILS